jgi:hypothetical protein
MPGSARNATGALVQAASSAYCQDMLFKVQFRDDAGRHGWRVSPAARTFRSKKQSPRIAGSRESALDENSANWTLADGELESCRRCAATSTKRRLGTKKAGVLLKPTSLFV